MSVGRIANGPWLLAPTPHQITIVWETEQPEELYLLYQQKGEAPQQMIPVKEQEPACPDNIKGYCLYTVVLSNLMSGTLYEYAICDSEGELMSSSFTTLSENPECARFVTISDSHLFYTSEAFANMLKRYRPDMLLHGGDISFGTGYQHEQYVNNWFSRLGNELRWLPAYYIVGNHDDGPFFDLLFASRQGKSVNSPDGGFTFSFDYGPVHIVMVNSNPWGLFEMNAVNSGLEADDILRSRIRTSLEWIEQDLLSDAARNASWRIMITHHPYTDEFNNRYIAPLAERCNVNLVIGGHLHYYIKSVSADSEVGAQTVYVCQGSTQDPAAEIDFGSEGKRLLGDFPEVVAMGNSNYGILEATKDELAYRIYGFQSGEQDKLVDTICLKHSDPQVEILEPNIFHLDESGMVEIKAVACNKGQSPAAVVLPVEDNGLRQDIYFFGKSPDSRVVVLESGEKRQVIAFYQVQGAGKHRLRVLDAEQEVTVDDAVTVSYEHFSAFAGRGPAGECLVACAEATNLLDKDVTVTVPMYVNENLVETKRISLHSYERRLVEFCYRIERGGEYLVSLGAQLSKKVFVEEGICSIPRLHDRSGNGHDALLHGSPRLIKENGKTLIQLDHPGDYIEIPASPDLIAEQGFTGIVGAKVDRLARPDEMGHNPIMVRGKSVGWGATYFLRMVIERNGGLKWGTCHGITEYSWQGGEAAVGRLTQYTLSFDKTRGGTSYVDDEAVAHIAGIEADSCLRQWENEPIFVGYSYIGHVIPELGRPKYYTHLTGAIGQVRFYKCALTAEDNMQVLSFPDSAGPHSEDMAVWLDFDNIETVGRHITEWRHPAVYCKSYLAEKRFWHFTTLKADVRIPGDASLQLVVEVSDDRVSIKERMAIALHDGINTVILSKLPQAQFIRLTTELTAVVEGDGVFAPKVNSYEVVASNGLEMTKIIWATRWDWEKGTFNGAVGFEPVERLRDFPEYTDVIHG